ncbi:hypothetical protein KLER11_gp68 [Pararheinheimera phage vB_PsoM_KLER1-1]|nr:hypothetical protein KLER11_gp68 [Pararheinheimera phage vB_PsoM_KLER1-1]
MNKINSNGCEHKSSRGREGEEGSWCIDCGIKVLEVEVRPCGECVNYRESTIGPYCDYQRMPVNKEMLVTFKLTEGTCFESKPAANAATENV